MLPIVLPPIVERSQVCLLPRRVCALPPQWALLKRLAASSQPLDIFVNIFTVKFRKFPRVRSDAEGGLAAAAWELPAQIDPSLQAAQSCSAFIEAPRSYPDHRVRIARRTPG